MRIDRDILTPFADRFFEHTRLTPAERAEVLRIAQGFACKDSASATNLSPETIRARRKAIYRKLELGGSNELIATLLAYSLRMLARGESLDLNEAAPPADQGEAPAVGAYV